MGGGAAARKKKGAGMLRKSGTPQMHNGPNLPGEKNHR